MGTGKNCLIAAITLCVLLIVGILVAYFVVIPQIEGGIEESGVTSLFLMFFSAVYSS